MTGSTDGIDARLAVIERTVLDTHRRLYGNGQPGEIQLIHARISSVNTRVGVLESWKWWLTGAGAGFGALGGVIGYIIRAVL